MLKKFAAAMVHLLFFAGVVAIGAYWSVRIFTPAPTSAPPPLPPPPLRDPDATAAARMFGKVEVAQVAVAANIQSLGAFAAGKNSSAILVVDSKPPRVFLVGQEVVPGHSAGVDRVGSDRARQSERAAGSPAPASARRGHEWRRADAELHARRQYADRPQRERGPGNRTASLKRTAAATACHPPESPGITAADTVGCATCS